MYTYNFNIILEKNMLLLKILILEMFLLFHDPKYIIISIYYDNIYFILTIIVTQGFDPHSRKQIIIY